MNERRFARVVDCLSSDGFQRLRNSRISVIGLGGVGSHAALALARTGCGALQLVDFDTLTETSLNRNPVARTSDVGRQKVLVIGDSIARTCPDTSVETVHSFFHADTAADILQPEPDLVIDAIDSLNPKAALLEYCVNHGITVLSSMGASGRTDPSMVRVDDISRTRNCPLARQLRKYLRKRGIERGIRCVYSIESWDGKDLPPDVEDLTLKRGRLRNRLPSLITMPGIFGYALAGLAIDEISREREYSAE